MATKRLELGQLGDVLREQRKRIGGAMAEGAHLAAERGITLLKGESPVDMGVFRAAWQARRFGPQVWSFNDSPVAGVIERGARPHPVSPEGVEAIRRWVQRVVVGRGGGKKAQRLVDEITNGIVQKLRARGQKGLFIVERNLEKLRMFVEAETDRRLARLFNEGT